MLTSSRDRISVDLRGMKAALLVRARETGMTPSDLIRKAIAQMLDQVVPAQSPEAPEPDKKGRVRFSVRLRHEDALAIRDRAKAAGLSVGDYIVCIDAGSPTLLDGERPIDLVQALTASSAERSTLSRDLRHLLPC